MRSTIYVRPPDRRAKGKAPSGPLREVSGALFRYRVQLIPGLIAFFLGTWTAIMELYHVRLILPVVLACLGALIWIFGIEKPFSRPDSRRKKIERAYGVSVIVIMMLWVTLSTWGAGLVPSLRWYAVLITGTYPVAAPWMWHRRIRGSIAITFSPGIPYKIRRQMEGRARTVISEWDTFTRASAASGSTLQAIHFDQYSVTLSVRFGSGRVAEDFTELRLRRLESAFDARRGSARVEAEQGQSSRRGKIRFMLADPLAEPLIATDADVTGMDDMVIEIGLFETGGKVVMDLIHTLIAGASGAGKSGIINAIMRALARKPKVAIVGIDMKPGALELGKWRDVMYACATNPLEAKVILEGILRGIHRRGEIMAERGIRTWVPTEEEPFIVLVIDEVHQLKKHRLFPLLIDISELGRAYGFALIMATQHPKDSSVPTEAIANCLQRIGLACEANTAERLIFGDNASKDGWRLSPTGMPLEGHFRIKSKRYKRPNLARAYWMDDLAVEADVERFTSVRTEIDEPTWHPGSVGTSRRRQIEPDEVETGTEGDDVPMGVIVEDDPEVIVYMAVCSGIGKLEQIVEETGVPRASVIRHIRSLANSGKIIQDGPRRPWRRAA